MIDGALDPEIVANLNAEFTSKVNAEVPAGALGWYLKTHFDAAEPRRVWEPDTICPPKVHSVLREIFSDPWWGLLHTDRQLPAEELGRYRLDHDNAHVIHIERSGFSASCSPKIGAFSVVLAEQSGPFYM